MVIALKASGEKDLTTKEDGQIITETITETGIETETVLSLKLRRMVI